MTVQNSGSRSRTLAEASGGGHQERRASTNTSSSPRSDGSLQMRPEALNNSVEGSQQHEALTTPGETARDALSSFPHTEGPNASRIPIQGAARAAPARRVTGFDLYESDELFASSPTGCCLADPKQPQAPQTQQEQRQQQQDQQKQGQKEQQKEMLLSPMTMPSKENCIEDFLPLNLARRPSAEMLHHLGSRVAADKHEDPIGTLTPADLNPAKPAEAVVPIQIVPSELTKSREEMGTVSSVVAVRNINGSSMHTRVVNNGCGGADDSNNRRSKNSSNQSSRLSRPQQLPMTCDIPCALAGVTQPGGDCPDGPLGVVATGRPSAAASSSPTAAAWAGTRAEACATVTAADKKAETEEGLQDGECESPPAERRGSTSNNGGGSNNNDADNAQRPCCHVPVFEDTYPKLSKNVGGPQRQQRRVATVEALVPCSGRFGSPGSISPREHQGLHEGEHLQRPLQQQKPRKQPEILQEEKENEPQQNPQAQKQQQQQKPREFVRRLALGLLIGRRAGRKERRTWLGRCNSSGGRMSQMQPEQQQQQHEQEPQQQQPQEQQDDGAEWEACCLLQPADEKKDIPAANSRSNANNGTALGGYRRAPGKLQRMAFSFGCFGEASQRRTETQRENYEGALFPRGLANLKNTCFLNAALQALAGIPSFVASIQAGLPPEPGAREAQWRESPRACDASHEGIKAAANATAAAACSSTTASPDSEETRGQQAHQAQHLQNRSEQQRHQQQDLLQQQLVRREELLRRLRLQQERREKHQPECLGTLDENQRKLLLREFFTLLCRLTCCPSIRPQGSAQEPSAEDLAAQRPRESNAAATTKPENQNQQQLRQQPHMPAAEQDTIRPERLRRALVAPLAGLLLNDCNMQQQQDCHEFLRGLIDLIHEILKTCRWEREEAAAAEQLLQLQAISPVADVEPWVMTSFGSLHIPLAVDNDQPTQHHKNQTRAQRTDTPTEDNESSDPGKAVGGDAGDAERAEKKWREYIGDQASPMADFFAGQLCSEIQCAGCRQSLFIYEPAWDLSLPLPADGNKVSLNSLLEGFFGSEELEFSCSSCHSPACKAHRTIRYTHPPKVLLLQIKRFSASGQKRRTRVEYPLEELVIKTKRGSARFRLIAVIEHNGSSCQSGHYVAYVRRRRFVAPVALPSSTAGAASGKPETPRSSACSPSEFLKRIGILKGFTSLASHSLRHPNGPSTAPLSGPSPRDPPHESPLRPPRQAMSFEGMADDGTEGGEAKETDEIVDDPLISIIPTALPFGGRVPKALTSRGTMDELLASASTAVTASATSSASSAVPSASTPASEPPSSAATEYEAADEDALRRWFPATCPDYKARCGDVKQLVKEDLEDPHRRKHLESFKQSMLEWEAYDPSIRNVMQEETANAFLADLLRIRPKTSKEFDSAIQALRKKYKVAPAKSQLVAAYKRLLDGEADSQKTQDANPVGPCGAESLDSQSCSDGLRNPMLESLMRRKAVRTNSGVLVITVLTAPGRFSCPQDCHYCPNEPGQPRSYLSTEPAVLRANQNGWSPLKQFRDRAGTLKRNGHAVDKIEVLVLGGTWSGYPQDYQEEFIRDIYYAANVFGLPEPVRDPLSLEEEQNLNETAGCRIVGLTLETRPDFISRYELRRLRRFGCTRVQIGVQHVDDNVLQYINRGCTRRDAIKAIRMLKDAGFKVDVHLMPDLPSSSPDADRQMFYYVLSSPDLQADQWKIYPCEVTPFSTIEQWYKEGKFIPYADVDGEALLTLICSVKAAVHPWVRLNRVVRDIPNQSIIGGNNVTNLRQELSRELESRHLRCKCIRCREVKDEQLDLGAAELCVRRYETNGGVEFFLSFETPDRKTIFGFLRLRLRARRAPRDCPFSVLNGAALLRELHVYGRLVPHGEAKSSGDLRPQHAGFGRRLIQAAEIVAMANGYWRMAVIAGIGTREYYRASGYELEDSYMVKDLTVSGLHAGRPDLLAVQPKELLIEFQDLPRAAAQLLLPLPPKAPLRKRKEMQGNRGKGKGKAKGGPGVDSALLASIEETRERASAFLTEYTTKVESINVPALLQRLKDSKKTQLDTPESPSLFADKDTFAEHCSMYASLQKSQKSTAGSTSALSFLHRCLPSWLLGGNADAYGSSVLLIAASAATVAVAGVATGLLWFAVRRRQ
ncbi:elongator complex protein 3, putative [Eimeria mitis]|uniref:Elongator complex protein 3, putative n=1 Tax=Eimeria mitis TaxID=44415 RepID=U6K4A6_9EIME|nr:elongator complex protein 3, putative [Eimeria mitis]CDJ31167.1 elongator complex protein 3, putative [Eimeria mitis]